MLATQPHVRCSQRSELRWAYFRSTCNFPWSCISPLSRFQESTGFRADMRRDIASTSLQGRGFISVSSSAMSPASGTVGTSLGANGHWVQPGLSRNLQKCPHVSNFLSWKRIHFVSQRGHHREDVEGTRKMRFSGNRAGNEYDLC